MQTCAWYRRKGGHGACRARGCARYRARGGRRSGAEAARGRAQETGLCEVGGSTCYYAHSPDQLRIDVRDIYQRAARPRVGDAASAAALAAAAAADGADRRARRSCSGRGVQQSRRGACWFCVRCHARTMEQPHLVAAPCGPAASACPGSPPYPVPLL